MKYIIAIIFFLALWFMVYPWYASYLRGIEIDKCRQLKPPYTEGEVKHCQKFNIEL